MANNNNIWAILLIGIFIFLYYQPSQAPSIPSQDSSGGSTIDPASIYDSDVTFTGQDKHVASNSVSTESVRVLKMNGDGMKDLGYKSLNLGTLGTTPGDEYKFYYYMNTSPSTQYYMVLEDYTAPPKDSTDNRVGFGCKIDTAPVFSVRNQNGVSNSASNPLSISTSQSIDLSITIKAHSDKCYGTPDAPKGNAICFVYPNNIFSKVNAGTPASIPYGIQSNVFGKTISCFEFPVLEDTSSVELNVDIQSSTTEPTTAHNITVYSDDIAFDLHGDDLSEIWGYTDEAFNQLAAPNVTLGTIYIS